MSEPKSEGDKDLIAMMRAKLAAQPNAKPGLAAALAKRRHEASVALGLKCPKYLNCPTCRPLSRRECLSSTRGRAT